MRDNLLKWSSNLVIEKIVDVPNGDTFEQKKLRQKADFNIYGIDNTYDIEFDDSAGVWESTISKSPSGLKLFTEIKLKIYKDNEVLDIRKMSVKFVMELERALINFITV